MHFSLKLTRRLSSESGAPLLRSALYELLSQRGGQMVPFAGYELPVQFKGVGVKKEHLHTRAAGCASLFDVSHMGQIKWHGADAAKFLESVVVGDIGGLESRRGCLSLITNEDGGIIDDTIIMSAADHGEDEILLFFICHRITEYFTNLTKLLNDYY